MKEILRIVFTIPRLKKLFIVYFLSILLAQGLVTQIFPLLDKGVNELIEKSITGESIDASRLYPYFIVLFVITVVFYIFNRISYWLGSIIQENVWHEIFDRGFAKLVYHDIEYLGKNSSGQLLNQVNRASSRVSEIFTNAAFYFLRNVLTAIGSLIIMVSISWIITVGVLGTVLIYFIIHMIRFKKDIPISKKRDDVDDKEFTRIWEVIPQLKLTKLFTNEEKEINNLISVREKILTFTRKQQKLWAYADLADVIFVQSSTIAVKLFSAYSALQGEFGFATFILLYALIDRAQRPMWEVNWFIWSVQSMRERSRKYVEIMNSKESVTERAEPLRVPSDNSTLSLENVNFSYSESKELVLKNISMCFEQNTFSALVGKSGSGKSTIMNLLCRFYDPAKGSVKLGGVDIRDLLLHDLRSKIGFVFQESNVFSGTIAENLRYGKENASDDELVEALVNSNAWEFVKVLKDGLETQIGERGVKLSGGQRQRLSIARTLLKDPQILLLDEATNALDSESEVLVQEALEKFMKGRTVIAIAHRLSTIQRADKIFVLDSGEVIESGNHKDLLQKDGVYKKLHDIQTGAFEEQRKLLEEYEMA